MSIHLFRDLENAQRRVLSLAADVEASVDHAMQALFEHDAAVAAELIESDTRIDLEENRIEEDCLKILALHQPVAIDLRRVTAILRINSDLERMADLAVNIGERARALAFGIAPLIPDELARMTTLAKRMVRDSLDSFVNQDVPLAKRVCLTDDEVDACNRRVIDQIIGYMKESPEHVEPGLHLFSASRHLERIADHATNIAEYVVYIIEGTIIRHHPEALTR